MALLFLPISIVNLQSFISSRGQGVVGEIDDHMTGLVNGSSLALLPYSLKTSMTASAMSR